MRRVLHKAESSRRLSAVQLPHRVSLVGALSTRARSSQDVLSLSLLSPMAPPARRRPQEAIPVAAAVDFRRSSRAGLRRVAIPRRASAQAPARRTSLVSRGVASSGGGAPSAASVMQSIMRRRRLRHYAQTVGSFKVFCGVGERGGPEYRVCNALFVGRGPACLQRGLRWHACGICGVLRGRRSSPNVHTRARQRAIWLVYLPGIPAPR